MVPRAEFGSTPSTFATGLIQPEGPIALSDDSLVVVEMGRGTLTRIGHDGRISVIADVGGGPNGAAIGPDGACYVVNNGGVSRNRVGGFRLPADGYVGGWVDRVDLDSGDIQRLYESTEAVPLTGLNDIVFDRWGGLWFTDCGKYHENHVTHGGVLWARHDGSEVRRVVHPLLAPNGIALSPDGETLYVVLMEQRQIAAYTITGPGTLASKDGIPVGRTVASLAGDMKLDSMKVERDGNLVIAAMCAGAPGQLIVVSPAGDVVEIVEVGTTMANNLAFGGPGDRHCYVALLRDGEVATLEWPRPGLRLLYT